MCKHNRYGTEARQSVPMGRGQCPCAVGTYLPRKGFGLAKPDSLKKATVKNLFISFCQKTELIKNLMFFKYMNLNFDQGVTYTPLALTPWYGTAIVRSLPTQSPAGRNTAQRRPKSETAASTNWWGQGNIVTTIAVRPLAIVNIGTTWMNSLTEQGAAQDNKTETACMY